MLRKTIVAIVLAAFAATSVQMPALAQIDPVPFMPVPGTMVHLSPPYTPAFLKGIVVHPENPLKFDFIIYKGDKPLGEAEKREEYTKLTKYFLASLAIPDDDQWVNLSPYEKDRIIKEDFGKTEMGRDLLAQDYLLKQITASLIYPESRLGKEFWKKVYAQAQKQYGTTDIPVNTFNKVWILPDDALIYEKTNENKPGIDKQGTGNITAYVLKNHLRVMLEEDYLSLSKHSSALARNDTNLTMSKEVQLKPFDTHSIASQIIRQIVLPELQKEVNEGQNFAPLRQVYSGMLLATWFKRTLKQSLLGQIYANKAKLKGIDQDPKTNDAIYRKYLEAYKKGVFSFIKEDTNSLTDESIPRKYFSGGTGGFGQAKLTFGDVVHTSKALTEPLESALRTDLMNADVATVAMNDKAMFSDWDGRWIEMSPEGRSMTRLQGNMIYHIDRPMDNVRKLLKKEHVDLAMNVPDGRDSFGLPDSDAAMAGREGEQVAAIAGLQWLRRRVENPKARVLVIEPIDRRAIDLFWERDDIEYDVLMPESEISEGENGYESISDQQLIEVLKEAHDSGHGYTSLVTFVNKRISKDILAAAPELRSIHSFGTGYDNLRDAIAQGAIVTNAPGPLTKAMAEFNVGLALEAMYRIPEAIYTTSDAKDHRSLANIYSRLAQNGHDKESLVQLIWGLLTRGSLKYDDMFKLVNDRKFIKCGVGPQATVLHDQLGQDLKLGVNTSLGIVAGKDRYMLDRLINLATAFEIGQINVFTGGINLSVAEKAALQRPNSNVRFVSDNTAGKSDYVIVTPDADVNVARAFKNTIIDTRRLGLRISYDWVLKRSLWGKTMAIAGLGRIGEATAKRMVALGMKIIFTGGSSGRSYEPEIKRLADQYNTLRQQYVLPQEAEPVRKVSKEELFQKADVLSPLMNFTEAARNYINKEYLDMVEDKDHVIILNTARGPVVNEPDLMEFMKEHPQAQARLDVLVNENQNTFKGLNELPNVKVTGHTGSAVPLVRLAMQKIAIVDNLLHLIDGKEPNNLVPELKRDAAMNGKNQEEPKIIADLLALAHMHVSSPAGLTGAVRSLFLSPYLNAKLSKDGAISFDDYWKGYQQLFGPGAHDTGLNRYFGIEGKYKPRHAAKTWFNALISAGILLNREEKSKYSDECPVSDLGHVYLAVTKVREWMIANHHFVLVDVLDLFEESIRKLTIEFSGPSRQGQAAVLTRNLDKWTEGLKWLIDELEQSPKYAQAVDVLKPALEKLDAAMSGENKGGIDLNSTHLTLRIKRDGNGVPLPVAQQDLAQLSNIQGLDPVILSIKPATQTELFSQLLTSVK